MSDKEKRDGTLIAPPSRSSVLHPILAMEHRDEHGRAQDVAVDGLHRIGAGGVGGQVELRIQRVQFKRVVVVGSGGSARAAVER